MEPRTHCPFCGAKNQPIAGTRHRTCRACGENDYLNPAPAVSVAALRGGKVLLSLRAGPPKEGEWDLVGGFIDAGETVEQALHREVLEETGCTLADVRFAVTATGDYAGQPTLNFMATARLVGTPKASDDSAELRWWPLEEVPPIAWKHEAEFVASLARRLGAPTKR